MSTSSTSRVTVRILWNPVCVMGATSHKPQQMKWEATLQPARREDSHNVVRQPAHSDSTPNIKAVVRSHMRDPTTATIADENRSWREIGWGPHHWNSPEIATCTACICTAAMQAKAATLRVLPCQRNTHKRRNGVWPGPIHSRCCTWNRQPCNQAQCQL